MNVYFPKIQGKYERGLKRSWTGAIKLILCKIDLSNFAYFITDILYT